MLSGLQGGKIVLVVDRRNRQIQDYIDLRILQQVLAGRICFSEAILNTLCLSFFEGTARTGV